LFWGTPPLRKPGNDLDFADQGSVALHHVFGRDPVFPAARTLHGMIVKEALGDAEECPSFSGFANWNSRKEIVSNSAATTSSAVSAAVVMQSCASLRMGSCVGSTTYLHSGVPAPENKGAPQRFLRILSLSSGERLVSFRQ
jgi:hypothetical protein